MGQPLYIAGTGTFAAEIAVWAGDAGIDVAGLIAVQRPDEAGIAEHAILCRGSLVGHHPGEPVRHPQSGRQRRRREDGEEGWR